MILTDIGMRCFKLDGSEIAIGRDPSCAISLTGIGISRFHAVLHLNRSKPYIVDSNSSFGIRINDIPISEKELNDGDYLTVGIYRFVVEIDSVNDNLLLVPQVNSEHSSFKETNICGALKIGRDPGCDIFFSHPLVSRHHATVREYTGKYLTVTDNRSVNGTFVNGIKINEKQLENGDVVQIGPYRLYVDGTQLLSNDEFNRIRLEVSGVSTRLNGNRVIDDVSLTIHPGEFVTLLGPSGAGKSTLTRILSGHASPDSGIVLANGLPLHKHIAAFAANIGYVSQENILYPQLTVAEMFYEQCRLRLPNDCTVEERKSRIDETLRLLEIEKIVDRRIGQLSGGEAKRVHLGIELLSSPMVIFLDEPLAGLDPGLVRKFMILFRRISDRGHTVILTTHTLEQIELCDRLIFLNKGRIVFNGSSADICTQFTLKSIAELFEKSEEIVQNQRHQAKIPKNIYNHALLPDRVLKRSQSCNFFSQTQLLIGRYNKLLLRDQKNVLLIALQAPLIAILISIVFGNDTEFLPMSFYFCVCISAIWIGGVATIREFAGDWTFLSRDCGNGLSINAYIVSKLFIATEIAIFVSTLFGLVLKLVFFKTSFAFSFILISGAGTFCGAILGLCISAWSGHVGRAISLLPTIFIPQIFFSGILVPFDRMHFVGEIISQITISRPIFSMFKENSLLHRSITLLNGWNSLLFLLSGFIILIVVGVKLRCKRF